ncbi:MAG: UbiD family decarboxylase [Bradyrhizobium sp.]|uniref:UbiD family decarboxylase n=1 Tax=Bradyrhizobium sp. TaxID=376 RepID=UPI001DF9497C|nr:UbiD family decarboxylase [Bradyrhizobium sp.]MBV9559667.1 UbiD family decarboxylase [Bradyrhizobium sp.]
MDLEGQGRNPAHIKSLRDFLAALQRIDEVQGIDKEVDWNLEMGAITRRSMDLRAPAPLFNKIKGIEAGFRAFGAPGGLSANSKYKYSRVALALGLPADAPPLKVVEALKKARSKPPLPPRIVPSKGAPCKQNVLLGEEIDLLRFPTPLIHGADGGRYIQTFGLNIVRTPDGSWTNWSINRMMQLDRNRIACLIPPNQHLGIIHAKWKERGEPTPIAVALGVEPGLPYVGGMPIPEGMDEAAFLGAYFGEPLELVRAETVEIDVPATAEIVIEGHISHAETAMEGPMDEYPGYVGESGSPKPVLTVSAITFRTDPILPFSTAGAPVDENHTGWGIPHAAEILHLLQTADFPVGACWMVLESACHWLVIAARTDWHEMTGLDSRAFGQRIGELIFSSKAGFGIAKVLLIENDINVTDVEQVVWAFASRAHPSHGEIYFNEEAQNSLPVFLDSGEKFTYRTTKVIHNALLADRFPVERRPKRSDLENGWPASIGRQVIENWRAYGYR